MPTPATFNALNGEEYLKVILTKVESTLRGTNEFKTNLSFPLTRFEFDIRVWTYPKESLEGKPGIVASARVGEPQTSDPSDRVTNTQVIDQPDKARVEAKLEIPKAVPGPGTSADAERPDKVLVDKRTDIPILPTESLAAAIAAAGLKPTPTPTTPTKVK